MEAGRRPNGDPDLFFRGFYARNSEVGSKTLGMASLHLRTVCMNRNIWGADRFEEISIRHSKFAANRFAHEAAPALENVASSSPAPFIQGSKRRANASSLARREKSIWIRYLHGPREELGFMHASFAPAPPVLARLHHP